MSEVLGSFRVSRASWTSSIGFRTTQEAKAFFFTRNEFLTVSKLVKCPAVIQAALRTIARQVFVLAVLATVEKSCLGLFHFEETDGGRGVRIILRLEWNTLWGPLIF